ncbi:prepilin-type N-terminal cleavage/methylation domain-containing protein [Rhodoferax bucti]|uniref:prepilin-type N-terminal cleavage/methylation domain-containing protein n=1 Tax=Rhodoferax bucti TaxID=2576305 RepID=UPI00147788D8|nr:prepilin-type N-terminal cleavage/methylation domain-containing protein [Rhodoferax bucti]
MKKNKQSFPRRRQRGFTLVELMIALFLGILIIGALLTSLLSNKDSLRVSENLARMQENSRLALELMSRDIREAGENPCGAKLMANVIRSGGNIPWWASWGDGAIQGFSGATDTTSIVPFGTAEGLRVNGTAAILVLQAGAAESNVTAHNTGSTEITVMNASNFVAGDILMSCDLQGAAIFQAGTVDSATNVINYDSSTATLNCGNGLGYPTTVACTTTTLRQFSTTNGIVTKLVPTFWYIGNNSTGGRSLYRTQIARTVVGGATQITNNRDEILNNVVEMNLSYLKKNSTTETLATTWVDADDSELAVVAGGWGELNPNQVVAVRTEIKLQSEEVVSASNTKLERTLLFISSLRSRETLY